MDQDHMDALKHGGDLASVGAIAATIIGWLPQIAALLAVVWWIIRIYETRTVQSMIANWRKQKRILGDDDE